ncbi:MAG: hypothetical protein IPG50_23285 [Myxococcales bacterium]|nr:hypothetical protein [Myxococcales bacterium]
MLLSACSASPSIFVVTADGGAPPSSESSSSSSTGGRSSSDASVDARGNDGTATANVECHDITSSCPATGGVAEVCTTLGASGQCISRLWRIGAQTWPCPSCDSCEDSANKALGTCSNGSGGGGGGGGGGTETCTVATAGCTVGGEVKLCTRPGASCAQRYVHAGVSFPCPACGVCQAQYDEALVACMGAEGSCDALLACCGALAPPKDAQCTSSVATYRASRASDVQCQRAIAGMPAGTCP